MTKAKDKDNGNDIPELHETAKQRAARQAAEDAAEDAAAVKLADAGPHPADEAAEEQHALEREAALIRPRATPYPAPVDYEHDERRTSNELIADKEVVDIVRRGDATVDLKHPEPAIEDEREEDAELIEADRRAAIEAGVEVAASQLPADRRARAGKSATPHPADTAAAKAAKKREADRRAAEKDADDDI